MFLGSLFKLRSEPGGRSRFDGVFQECQITGCRAAVSFVVFFRTGCFRVFGLISFDGVFKNRLIFGFPHPLPLVVFFKRGKIRLFPAFLIPGPGIPLIGFCSGGYPDTLIFVLGHS